MSTTEDIINALGAEKIQALCGVGEFSVRAAKREGRFPASWYAEIDKACRAQGIECPRSLFAFKRAPIPDSGKAA